MPGAAVALATLLSTQAAGPLASTVEAELDAASGRIAGSVRHELASPAGDPVEVVYLWLYPNRFRERPAALDDVSFPWVYPGAFDAGWMRVRAARVGGRDARVREVPHALAGDGTLVEVTLPRPAPRGERVVIDVDYEAKAPRRHGSFGCRDEGCVLAGGFYPMLARIDEDGWDLAAGPQEGTISGTLGGKAFRAEGAYATVVTGKLHDTRRVRDGVTVAYAGREPPPPAGDAAGQILAYSEEDYAAMALDVAERCVDVLAELGAPVAEGTRVRMVEAPLRLALAEAHPGVVLVSDRLFRLFPARAFRRYHERELARAVFVALLAEREAGGVSRETAEAAASWLAAVSQAAGEGRLRLARQMLSPVSFVPAIDELLYAPQVAFASAYFGGTGGDELLRDDPRLFANQRPRGWMVYEKLVDLFHDEELDDALAQVMSDVIVDGAELRAAAESARGEDLGWFFAQWSGRTPRVNLALGARRRERVAGGRWRHTIEVRKQAIGGDRAPVEPVEVRVVDGAGQRFDLRWHGRGDAGEVVLDSASASLRSVELDPRLRITQAGASPASDDPRFDDRAPPRWKFLYNGFGALFDVGRLQVGLLADFSFRRRYDTRNDVRLIVFSSEEVTIGGSLGYSRHFGRAITPLRRAASAGVRLAASRLDGDFAGAPSAGTRVSLSLLAGTDDRLFLFEPRHARGASAGARLSFTRFDAEDDTHATVTLFADATRIVTPHDLHTFVGVIDAAAVLGDVTSRSQLVAGGGFAGLRGYLPGELSARARVMGHLEWRGTLDHDLAWNVGHWWIVRGVGAAAFVDAGVLSTCEDAAALDGAYASAGFGLRTFYDNFGVQPGMMALDFAVPLVLRPRACLGAADLPLARPPFTLTLTFLPPF